MSYSTPIFQFTHHHSKIQQQHKVKWAQQVFLLHDSARLTTRCQTTKTQVSFGFTVLPHLSYSPVLGLRLCHVWQDQGVTVWQTIPKQWLLAEHCLGISACYQPSKVTRNMTVVWGASGVCYSVIVQLSWSSGLYCR